MYMQTKAKGEKGRKGCNRKQARGGRYGDATAYVSPRRILQPPPPRNCLYTCLCAVRQGRTTAQYLPAYYPTTADARGVTTVAGHQANEGMHSMHCKGSSVHAVEDRATLEVEGVAKLCAETRGGNSRRNRLAEKCAKPKARHNTARSPRTGKMHHQMCRRRRPSAHLDERRR